MSLSSLENPAWGTALPIRLWSAGIGSAAFRGKCRKAEKFTEPSQSCQNQDTKACYLKTVRRELTEPFGTADKQLTNSFFITLLPLTTDPAADRLFLFLQARIGAVGTPDKIGKSKGQRAAVTAGPDLSGGDLCLHPGVPSVRKSGCSALQGRFLRP